MPASRFTLFSLCILCAAVISNANDGAGSAFFESKIRPILVEHCYECHSEKEQLREGGLLLDRPSGWLEGGDTEKAVIPGQPETSLLMVAVRYSNDDLQMPPDGKLSDKEIGLLKTWIERGAPGPADDMGATEFSRLGDQVYLFDQASDHWAFQTAKPVAPPKAENPRWNSSAIDRFVFDQLQNNGLAPSSPATAESLVKRLHFSITGLPPSFNEVRDFAEACKQSREAAIEQKIAQLLATPAFGQHIGRMWLDVARYADTDSSYRADTKTPYYFPFAFTYRDYVIESFNHDKPFNEFVTEQFAADLIGFKSGDPEIAALGFFGVGPYQQTNSSEALDDWIDVTTRGLMGMTVACARCHDHKYEPVPTADYYSLRGVFAGLDRINPTDTKRLPTVNGYQPAQAEVAAYEQKLAVINKKIADAGNKKAKNNNRPIAKKIRDTELAHLLLFEPGGPAHAMVVRDKKTIPQSFIFVRGDATSRGDSVPRRFLKILDPEQPEFDPQASGRLDLAKRIVAADNPLTARVFVNRVWGFLMGSHLVSTPSDFGLQGSKPSHPELLDWLAIDFVKHGWSTKRLVRQIVSSQAFAQRSRHRDDGRATDSENALLWRANRRHLTIEMLRDRALKVSGELDLTPRGRSQELWGENYTRRRAIYGYINRFNLDPTLRAFDFPTPMHSKAARDESIVASQALFTMNSPFIIDQAKVITGSQQFADCKTESEKTTFLFREILQRDPHQNELVRIEKFHKSLGRLKPSKRYPPQPWPLVAQSLMMSNEFQYVD